MAQGKVAKMQDMGWDDLRVFAVVAELGSFAAAAAQLNQHETTVARRVRRLERCAGQSLWLGPEAGLTDAGLRLREHAVAMQDQARAAQATLRGALGPTGHVRLTAVPWLVDLAVIPAVAQWQAEAPDVTLSLIADHGNLSLLQGEADIALRLARPEGEGDAVAHKLCDIPFVVGGAGKDWIGYVSELAHLPQAQWTDDSPGQIGCRVTDQMSAIAACRAGMGRAWVPQMAATDGTTDTKTRPLWCITHPRSRRNPAIRAVIDGLLPLVVAALRG